jgi:hypothetical protein
MRAKFIYEAIEDIFRPKSEKEINDLLEEIYDKIAVDLLANFDFNDYQEAYYYVLRHSKTIEILIKKGYPMSDIGFLLYFENEPKEIVNEAMKDILKPKSEEEIEEALEDFYDDIILSLLDFNYFDDYNPAYAFVVSNKERIREYIETGHNAEEIAYMLWNGAYEYDS